MSRSSIKPKAWIKALLIVIIVLLAGGSDILASHPVQGWPVDLISGLSVTPDAIHVVPGEGQVVLVSVVRSAAFAGEVAVSLVNAPSWVSAAALVINPTASNGTLAILTTTNAPKGPVTLTVRGTASGGATQTAQLYLKVVGTFAVTNKFGSVVLYDTTKVLNDTATLHALVSSTNDSLTFSQSTPFLQSLDRGDVIIIDPNAASVIPRGLFRMVQGVRQSGGGVIVQIRSATLLDAILQAHGPHSPVDVTLPVIPEGPQSISWNGCQQDIAVTPPSLTFGANTLFGLDVVWDFSHPIPSVDYFQMLFQSHGLVGVSVKTSKAVNAGCNISLYSTSWGPIWLWPPFLWLTIDLDIKFGFSGSLNQPVSVTYGAEFNLLEGPKYCTANFCGGNLGWKWVDSTSLLSSSGNFLNPLPKPVNAASAKLTLGPDLSILLDGQLGNTLSTYVFANVYAMMPHDPLVWVVVGLDIVPGFSFLDLGFKIWGFKVTLLKIEVQVTAAETNFITINLPELPVDITITNPTHGATIKWGEDTANPQFNVKITDPQGVDDVCVEAGLGTSKVVWTSDVNGPFATGCSPTINVGVLSNGPQTITVTATNPKGVSSTSSPVKITIASASLVAVISTPTGDPLPKGTLGLSGYAYWLNPSGSKSQIDCNDPTLQLTWSTGGQAIGQGCTATATFLTAGQTVSITLTAKVHAVSGATTVKVSIIEPQLNPPPAVFIKSPQDQTTYTATFGPMNLEGSLTQGTYVSLTWEADWSVSGKPYSYQIPTGSFTFSWNVANTLCQPNTNFPIGVNTIPVTIKLTATDQSNRVGFMSVVVNMACQTAVGVINPWPFLMVTPYPLFLSGLVPFEPEDGP